MYLFRLKIHPSNTLHLFKIDKSCIQLSLLAICRSWNGESGNGMRRMMRTRGIRVGTQAIKVGMWGIRVGMREMVVGMLEM